MFPYEIRVLGSTTVLFIYLFRFREIYFQHAIFSTTRSPARIFCRPSPVQFTVRLLTVTSRTVISHGRPGTRLKINEYAQSPHTHTRLVCLPLPSGLIVRHSYTIYLPVGRRRRLCSYAPFEFTYVLSQGQISGGRGGAKGLGQRASEKREFVDPSTMEFFFIIQHLNK